MGRIDIHLHLQNEKGLMEMSSTVVEMLPHLEELGIDHGVLMSISNDWNEHNMKSVQQHPDKYSWMCHVELDDDIEGQILRHKANGAIGIGEITHNIWIEREGLQQLFAAAEKHNMPVLFHMSGEEGFSYGICDKPGLTMLEESLKKFPNLKFIGHSQTFWHEMTGEAATDKESRNQWGQGPVKEGGRVPHLFENYPNLYGDLSANSGGQAIMRDEEFGLEFLHKYADRLFFATDMVNVEMKFPLGEYLDKQLAAGKLDKEVYEKICWKNAEKLIKGQL